jgi:dCMP deaminase
MINPINKTNLFMSLAYAIAQGSKDIHTRVGSVIVGKDQEIISMGWNGFPRGINDSIEERYSRPTKYLYTVHSEINSILNAARIGVSCKRATLYTTLFCCNECAKAVIQAGIVKVVYAERKENWEESFKISEEMFSEAGVEVEKWLGKL